jgi:hypothetical protein
MASPSIAFMSKEAARTGQESKNRVYGQSFKQMGKVAIILHVIMHKNN